LGTLGEEYTGYSGVPSGADPEFRKRPFAMKARQALAETTDPKMLAAAVGTLLMDGGILWADGKLDWDYTPMGIDLLARAKKAAPEAIQLWSLETALPAHGVHPPQTLRIGGNLQAKNLVRKVTPQYPPLAKSLRIQGTVRFLALIGTDGKIKYLKVEQGPKELIQASYEAVRDWEYKPTLYNGRPCYVITQIDVNYQIG
jgi:TonB family protein